MSKKAEPTQEPIHHLDERTAAHDSSSSECMPQV